MKIIQGDCLDVMKTLETNSVDSIVSDPPYGISFMGKKWDYDIPSVEVWQECLRVLKPGGHILIACGTRTQHRMAVNIEDAGFELRDIICWLTGQGMPKSLNIGKKIDQIQGNEREVVGKEKGAGTTGDNQVGNQTFVAKNQYKNGTHDITKGNSPYEGLGTAIKPAWEAWTLARKPLDSSSNIEYNIGIIVNKIILCLSQLNVLTAEKNSESNQKELKEDVNIAQWTVGENINTLEDLFVAMDMLQLKLKEDSNLNIVLSWLNILAGIWSLVNTATTKTEINLITELKILKLMEWENILVNITQKKDSQINGLNANVSDAVSLFNVLRMKLNDIFSHTAQENVSSVQLDPRVNMELWTLARKPLSEKTIAENVLKWGTGGINIDGCRVGETGARTNSNGKRSMYGGNSLLESKTHNFKTKEHNYGRYPANLIHSGEEEVVSKFPDSKAGKNKGEGSKSGGIWQKSTGKPAGQEYGDNGSASRFFKQCEFTEADRIIYTPKASKAERKYTDENGKEQYSNHPTHKPVKLMCYLVRLITPKGGTCLDPYTGSGSTGIACKEEGFDFIGIEMEEQYCEIAGARTGMEVIQHKENKGKASEIKKEKLVEKDICECGGKIKKISGGRVCEDCLENK